MSSKLSNKMNLLKQLTYLSNDEQILPYIDQQTACRIKEILQQHQSVKILEEYQNLNKKSTNIKSKTQMDQINQLYQQNFPNLFEQNTSLALKDITVGLKNNQKNMPKSKTLSSKINKNNPISLPEQQHKKNLAQASSNFNIFKYQASNKENLIDGKKPKQKLISYKIGGQTPIFNKNTHSFSQLSKTQSIQKTPKKKQSMSKANSKSNLKSKQNYGNLKRSQSQRAKSNNIKSLSSSVKQINFSAFKNSQQKNSFLSTNKVQTNYKKQNLQQTAKRQIKSFSSIENHSNIKNSNYGSRERSKSKQINSKNKDMLKKIHKMNKQFSTENKIKKVPIFFQEIKNDKITGKIEQQKIFKRYIASEIFNQNDESDKQIQNYADQSLPQNHLREIIVEIYNQQNQKIEQKQNLQQKISKLKQKISSQNRRLQQTKNKNNKLIREIQTITEFRKSITQQRQNIQKLLNERKRKIKSLKQTLRQNKEILKNLTQNQLKQQQQLVEMYENVIGQLKKEIRQQNKKKSEIKSCLQKSQKKLQSKQSKFNSTFFSTQKIKHDLTDAFKEWI